jgi:hypothetical protein
MSSSKAAEPWSYGNFQPARRLVLGGLGPSGLAACFAVVLVAFVVLVAGGLLPAVVVLTIGAVVIGPVAWQIGGYSAADRTLRWLVFGKAARRGHTRYRSGVISPMGGTHRPPGIGWSSRVWNVETGRAGWDAVGIVLLPGPPRYFAVTLRCSPPGTTLVDPDTVHTWISQHGAWLENLGKEPDLAQAQVTVETAPDLGLDLARAVAANRHPKAPALADAVMDEVVATYPTAAARAETRVTLVFRAPTPTKPRTGGPARKVSDKEMCVRIASRLPQLAEQLRHVGSGVVKPMSAGELAAVCRVAYDPASAADVAAAGRDAVVWANCGPVAANEARDYYEHDASVSVTWGTAEVPRAQLHDTALTHLAAPDATLRRKRVTLLLRPLSPAQTARLVDADVKDARFAASRKARPTARDIRRVEATTATAQEEAAGATLVCWSILYTATVGDVDDLDAAEATIRDLAAVTRLTLRPMHYSQAAAFAVGLPIGIVPSQMAQVRW